MKFLFLFLLCICRLEAFQYEVAICAIFQDEARFLKEWIEFHRMIGVDHFYLYNNLSSDSYQEVLQPYIEEGIVELKQWNFSHNTLNKWNRIQVNAYQNCINKTRNKVHWLALIDLDEFIVPLETQNLKLFLNNYEEFSGVGINWQTYGTSSIEKIPDNKLMIELLTQKLPTHQEKNRMTKCIIQPTLTHHLNNPHWVYFSKGYKVDANREPFIYAKSATVAIDKIRLNHYIVRDREYLIQVKYPRLVKRHSDYTLEKLLESDREYCQEVDSIMEAFVPSLKARMGFN
jgi:hypothetical protein